MGRPAPWACLALLALHLLVTETDRLFYDMGTVTVAAGQSVNDRAGGATAQLRPIVQPRRHRTRRRRLREEARPEARPEERRPEDARPLDIEPPPAPLAGQDGSVELPEARDPGPPGGEATTQKDQPGPRRTRAHPPEDEGHARGKRGGPVPPPARFAVEVAPLLSGRHLAISGDPGTPAAACYHLDTVTPARPALHTPQVNNYKAFSTCPAVNAVTGGLGVDGVFYPLAGLRNPWLGGLGLHGALTVVIPTPQTGIDLAGELGLRWVLHGLLREGDQVGLTLDWRVHYVPNAVEARQYPTGIDGTTTVDGTGAMVPVAGVDSHGLPGATYQSLAVGLSLYLPYASIRGRAVGLGLDARYLAMLAFGEIADLVNADPPFSGGYGPATGHGGMFRLAPFDIALRPDLRLGLLFSYELYRLQFGLADAGQGHPLPPSMRGAGDGPRFLAPGATDDFVTAQVYLKYRFGKVASPKQRPDFLPEE